MAKKKNKRQNKLQDLVTQQNSELCQRVREFLEWLRVKNFAAKTVGMRKDSLNVFVNWCSERGIEQVSQINEQIIGHYEKYLLHKKGRDDKAMSAANRYINLTAVSKFSWWLEKYDYVVRNPAHKIIYPHIVKKLPKHVPSHKQVEQILMQPDVDKPLELRDRVMMEVLYSTGLRKAELAALRVPDIDLTNNLVYVRRGKGGKARVVPLGERAKEWLEKYLLDVRPKLAQDEQLGMLFMGNFGKALNADTIATKIGSYVRQAGQSGACHIFRHAMATGMLNGGADLRHIQEILGHQNINTTEIYTHTSLQRLQQVYERTHPASKGSTLGIEQAVSGRVTKSSGPIKAQENYKPSSSELWWWIEQYLESLRLANYSPKHINTYQYFLSYFEKWCSHNQISKPAQIEHRDLELYHKCLAAKTVRGHRLATGTIVAHLTAVKQLSTFIADNRGTVYNVGSKLEVPKMIKNIPCQVLSVQEVAAILEQAHTTSPLGLRDRAVMEVLYATGVRQQEMVGIELADINFEERTLRVTKGKGGKERIIPIAQGALAWLEKYILEVRPMLTDDPTCKTVFLSKASRPLDTESLNTRLQRFAQAAGVQKPCTCHKLRHAMATAMLDSGADIRSVQEILGHENLSSTQIYTKVAIRKLKEVHAQTHPARSKAQLECPQNK